MLGPVVYAIVILALGSLTPGYSQVSQLISELGAREAPYSVIMNTIGFPLLGGFLLIFAVGFHRGLGRSRGSTLGPALISLTGVTQIGVAFFPCVQGCTSNTTANIVHSAIGNIGGYSMVVAPFVVWLSLKNAPSWKTYRWYSLASGITSVILALAVSLNPFLNCVGALQRSLVGVGLLWLLVMAIGLYRLSKQGDFDGTATTSPRFQV